MDLRAAALKWAMAALSVSVGCAAATSTAVTFGGTGGYIMDLQNHIN
jgi:hypothetical protein